MNRSIKPMLFLNLAAQFYFFPFDSSRAILKTEPPFLTHWISRFMRFFFHHLYHAFAWGYDLVASVVSMGQWQRWVQASESLISGKQVLELGFGPGHLQTRLHRSGLQVTGLDESAQMASQAHRRLRKLSYAPRLVRGLAQQLPFVDQSFECVVATFPTLYITHPDSLAEIYRVLKTPTGASGCRLVVLMAAWITGNRFSDRVLRTLFRVTNQTPPEDQNIQDFLQPYLQAGFQASIRFMDVSNERKTSSARLMFILAAKK